MAFFGYYCGNKRIKALWAGASEAESQVFSEKHVIGIENNKSSNLQYSGLLSLPNA
jgi:hypothetical protein